MIAMNESTMELLQSLKLADDYASLPLQLLEMGESRYLRDLKVNLNNALVSEHLNEKETALLALAIAANQKNNVLIALFDNLAKEKGATEEEVSEAAACASLLAGNNILYRFRHFVQKEKYNQLPGRIKMNIMMRPATGKEFFELISLAVSAVNGCEMCVRSHENSLIELGSSEERIFDSIRLSAIVASLDKIFY
jgi:lipoyl-dependent peroxiredoxin subunit D